MKQVLETIGSVAGIRVGTEEPAYTAQPLIDSVEIRRYGTRIAAQTAVEADEEAARDEGFRRLASYIFGANHATPEDRHDRACRPAGHDGRRPEDRHDRTGGAATRRATGAG